MFSHMYYLLVFFIYGSRCILHWVYVTNDYIQYFLTTMHKGCKHVAIYQQNMSLTWQHIFSIKAHQCWYYSVGDNEDLRLPPHRQYIPWYIYLRRASRPEGTTTRRYGLGQTCCFSFGLAGCIDMSQLSAALETWLYTAAMFIMTTMVYKDKEEPMLRHHHCVCFMFL